MTFEEWLPTNGWGHASSDEIAKSAWEAATVNSAAMNGAALIFCSSREGTMDEWIKIDDPMASAPPPLTEVLVWIDGHRGPSWRNNHHLVAYQDTHGGWWEERHPSDEPLNGVIAWMPLPDPYIP
jgi:hypothetical protein